MPENLFKAVKIFRVVTDDLFEGLMVFYYLLVVTSALVSVSGLNLKRHLKKNLIWFTTGFFPHFLHILVQEQNVLLLLVEGPFPLAVSGLYRVFIIKQAFIWRHIQGPEGLELYEGQLGLAEGHE